MLTKANLSRHFQLFGKESAPNTLPISPQDLIKMTSNIAWTNSCNPCTLAEKHGSGSHPSDFPHMNGIIPLSCAGARSQLSKCFQQGMTAHLTPGADIKLDQDEAHSKEYWNSNHCNHSSLVKAWTQAPLSAQWQKRCWQCWAAWSCSPVRGLKYLSCLLRSV